MSVREIQRDIKSSNVLVAVHRERERERYRWSDNVLVLFDGVCVREKEIEQ